MKMTLKDKTTKVVKAQFVKLSINHIVCIENGVEVIYPFSSIEKLELEENEGE